MGDCFWKFLFNMPHIFSIHSWHMPYFQIPVIFFHASNSIPYQTWILPSDFRIQPISISKILHIVWRGDKNFQFQVAPEKKITRSHVMWSWRLIHFIIPGSYAIGKRFMKPMPYCSEAIYWSSILKVWCIFSYVPRVYCVVHCEWSLVTDNNVRRNTSAVKLLEKPVARIWTTLKIIFF